MGRTAENKGILVMNEPSRWLDISAEQSSAYKALAILMIALHNFMHAFPMPQQNEFAYDYRYFESFIHIVLTQPENIVQAVFSYMGHYGVQVFIFLSAYGLSKKYTGQPIRPLPFFWSRVMKIYPTFILCLIAWAVLRVAWRLYSGGALITAEEGWAVLFKLLLVSNFVPGYALEPVGPWWFLPFIFQFYVLFVLFFSVFLKHSKVSLFMCFAVGLISSFLWANEGIGIYYNVLPHLPILALGLYCGSRTVRIGKPNAWVILALFGLYLLSNVTFLSWHLSALLILMVLMPLFYSLHRLLQNSRAYAWLLYVGQISMVVFFVNGFARTPWFEFAVAKNHSLYTILYCAVFLVVTLVASAVIYEFNRRFFEPFLFGKRVQNKAN